MYIKGDRTPAQISQETRDWYLKVKSVYSESGYDQQYPLTDVWGKYNQQLLLDIIHRIPDPAEQIAAVHNTFMFSINTADEDVQTDMVDWYIAYLLRQRVTLEGLDPSIQESPYSNPRNATNRDGRLLSPDFLRSVVLALEIEKYCHLPDGKFNVLELGPGYGALARTLKLFHPGISYVLVDLPESLYISSTFLRLNFPTARVCYAADSSFLQEPLSEYDFVFVPTMFAEALVGEEFTLFCNTASLGEMTNSVIKYWMDFVQPKVSVKYFFGLNRFLNTVDLKVHPYQLEENCASVSFDAAWRILQWELQPPFTQCPYLEATHVTRNLQFVAERLHGTEVDTHKNVELSRKLAEKVSRQDWFNRTPGDDALNLTPDFTMMGTLFSLWESIRLHPNPVNVKMMLQYMGSLSSNTVLETPLEERFFYQGLLESLTGTSTGVETPTPRIRRRLAIKTVLDKVTTPTKRRFMARLFYGY